MGGPSVADLHQELWKRRGRNFGQSLKAKLQNCLIRSFVLVIVIISFFLQFLVDNLGRHWR